MSDEEKVIQLLDKVPDYKIGYVLAYLQGITADEETDDKFCESLLQDYLNDKDSGKHEVISIEEFAAQEGITLWYNIRYLLKREHRNLLSNLPKQDKVRLLKAVYELPKGDIKPMQGYDEYFRLRVGDYRIIYTVDNGKLVICVVDAGNRGNIYKKY